MPELWIGRDRRKKRCLRELFQFLREQQFFNFQSSCRSQALRQPAERILKHSKDDVVTHHILEEVCSPGALQQLVYRGAVLALELTYLNTQLAKKWDEFRVL